MRKIINNSHNRETLSNMKFDIMSDSEIVSYLKKRNKITDKDAKQDTEFWYNEKGILTEQDFNLFRHIAKCEAQDIYTSWDSEMLGEVYEQYLEDSRNSNSNYVNTPEWHDMVGNIQFEDDVKA